jgi:hypothetical protein
MSLFSVHKETSRFLPSYRLSAVSLQQKMNAIKVKADRWSLIPLSAGLSASSGNLRFSDGHYLVFS